MNESYVLGDVGIDVGIKKPDLAGRKELVFKNYSESWIKIGLSTDACDRNKAESCASEAYKAAGLNPPKWFIWADDPIKCIMSKLILMDLFNESVGVGHTVIDKVWSDLWDKTGRHMWGTVDSNIWDDVVTNISNKVGDKVINVRNNIIKHVRLNLSQNVADDVWVYLINHVSDQVKEKTREKNNVFSNLNNMLGLEILEQIYGCHEAPLLSFNSFLVNELNLKYCEKLIPLMNLSEDCGWWAPYEHVCFLQEKPKTINMLDGVLHSENGPAIEYRGENSIKVWALWGVRVPQWVAETPLYELDIKNILAIQDNDIRSVLLKRHEK